MMKGLDDMTVFARPREAEPGTAQAGSFGAARGDSSGGVPVLLPQAARRGRPDGPPPSGFPFIGGADLAPRGTPDVSPDGWPAVLPDDRRPAKRLLAAAGLTGLAGLALIGYVLLQPLGAEEGFGWEPVTEEARLAVERATQLASAPPSPVPAPSAAADAPSPAPADHPGTDDPGAADSGAAAGAVTAPALSGDPAAVPPAPDSAGGPLDLNRATVAELDELPGIGPAKAQAIVDYRERHGAFGSVDQLMEVKGIGPKLLERLRPLVTVGAAGGGSAAGPDMDGR